MCKTAKDYLGVVREYTREVITFGGFGLAVLVYSDFKTMVTDLAASNARTAEILRERKKTAVSEWIFPNIYRPEEAMHPEYPFNRMKTLLRQAELPLIRFHDLRHTFATHALTGGVDAKTLSRILGHTNASFTLDTYTHVTTDMQKRASSIVGGFMEDLIIKEN